MGAPTKNATFLPYAYFEGKVVAADQAKIPVMTHGFQYGIGCFAGVRAYWSPEEQELYVFRAEDHYRRLLDSCRILLFHIPETLDDLLRITIEVTRRNAAKQNIYLRPMVYSASQRLTPSVHDVEHRFTLYEMPLEDYIPTDRGLRTMVSSWTRIDDNIIPARAKAVGGYLNSALAKSEALLAGCDEAILLNKNHSVAEGSAMNLFMVRRNRVVTPPVSEDILEGITRRTVLALAQEELGVEVEERPIARTELYVADEIFFCGTGAQVAWVEEVDRRPVAGGKIGPITSRLRSLYHEVVRGKVPKYRHWLFPIYGAAKEAAGGKSHVAEVAAKKSPSAATR